MHIAAEAEAAAGDFATGQSDLREDTPAAKQNLFDCRSAEFTAAENSAKNLDGTRMAVTKLPDNGLILVYCFVQRVQRAQNRLIKQFMQTVAYGVEPGVRILCLRRQRVGHYVIHNFIHRKR